MRDGVGNTLTVRNHFTIEPKQGSAEFCIELSIQTEPPGTAFGLGTAEKSFE